MKSVVKFSLKQVVFLNIVFVLLMVGGVYSLFTTPVENMPPVDIGKVFIQTIYYGASAEDVETLVTDEIEEALDGLESVEYIQSRSRRNHSSVEVKFIDDSDYQDIFDELRFRVQRARGDMPEGVEEPSFFYINTQFWMPVIIINVSGDIPNSSLKLLSDELKRSFIGVEGVKEVVINGEHTKEFHVSLDPEKLRRFGVTFNEAASAVRSSSLTIPTGRLGRGDTEYMLDAGRRLSTQQEVLDIAIRRDGDGNFIRIRDVVTTAKISHRDANYITSVGGSDTMNLSIKKEDNANAITIVREIQRISEEFQKAHERDDISIELTNDSTIEIEDSVRTLGGSMLLGIILVTIVLWITLGFRNAMLTAIGIPFSFLCTLIFIKITGQSINTISLFSFVLVSGIIVDDAVIILENVYRHMQVGKSPKEAIIDGVSEVMLPVISSALTSIFAFLPMLIMTGSTGDFFSVIPKTVAFALTASLIEALFILPIHILDWGPKTAPHKDSTSDEIGEHLEGGIFAPAWKIYFKILSVLLENKIKALATLLVVFLTAVGIVIVSVTGVLPLLKVQFFPGSYFRYHVTIQMPPGTSIEHTDSIVRDLSRYILSFGENQAMATVGIAGRYEAENYVWHPAHNHGQVVVTLPKESDRDFPDVKDNDTLLYLDHVRDKLSEFIREQYSSDNSDALIPFIKVFPENTGPPTGKAVNIRVSGSSRYMVSDAVDELMGYIEGEEEFVDLTDLDVNRPTSQKVVKFLPRQEKSLEYGIPPGNVTRLIAGALNGIPVGKFKTVDGEVDLLVRLARRDDEGNITSAGIEGPEDVLELPVLEHSSSPVYLRELVSMKYETEPSIRMRYNGKPALTISSNIRAGSRLSSARVQVLVKKFSSGISDRFPGVIVAFGGEFETTNRTFTSLTFAFLIAILIIYLILATQFKDYFQPIIIISAIMFAVIGVVFGMVLTRSTFTLGSFLAVVGLAGVAVNDSLVLIDFINVRRRQGKHIRDAVLSACSTRMRPVLITTVTTMFGLLPMALGIPFKSVAWAPMATAFVTGLAAATTLALLMIPVEYELSEQFRIYLRKKFGKTADGGSYDL